MRCSECERGISDGLAGVLSERRKRKLTAHLRKCPACRDFERAARLLQAEAPALASNEESEGAGRESWDRLRRAIAAEAAKPRKKPGPAPAWKWIFAAAPLFLAAAAGLYLLLRPGGSREARFYLAAEEHLGLITSELGDSPELEVAFNSLLESSLGDDLAAAEGLQDAWLESPLFYQDVSDEEWSFIVEELKKELGS